jgi:hypothetical protein
LFVNSCADAPAKGCKTGLAMELSKAVASTAVILGVLLAVGHARGGDEERSDPAGETVQQKIEKREEARRAAMIEQQRRSQIFERHCLKPVKTPEEMQACRAVYRKM